MNQLEIIRPKIRYVVPTDLDEIYEIERSLFEIPWTLQEFEKCLARQNNVMLSAVIDNRIVGYMVYELLSRSINMINLAVDILHQKKGVGTLLINNLKHKLNSDKRVKITSNVAEVNLNAQLFLKKMDFICTKTRKAFFSNNMDAYHFEYKLP